MWPRSVLGFAKVVDATGETPVEHPNVRRLRLKGAVTPSAGPTWNGLVFPAGVGPEGPTGPAGPAGADGAAGSTGPAGVAQAIQLHDTMHEPVLLLQLQSNTQDTSGNGYHQSLDTGSLVFTSMCPGLRGFQMGSARLGGATSQSALRITGDITIEFLLQLHEAPNGEAIVSFTAGQEDASSATNYLYQWQLQSDRRPSWFQEYDAGVNQSHTVSGFAVPPIGQVMHVAATRTAGIVQNYLNGRALGDPSAQLITPNGGTSSRLFIGGTGDTTPVLCGAGAIASLKIIPAALSATQIAAEFNRTLGRFYGHV